MTTSEGLRQLLEYPTRFVDWKSWLLQAATEVEALQEKLEHSSCLYSGPGRGDCEHFIGLPGQVINGQHDGPPTEDVYGKPNGWCWHCWWSYRTHRAEGEIYQLRKKVSELQHDVIAYRAALGYSVPADHDGKLANGETPQCGMCNSEYRKSLERDKERLDKLEQHLQSGRDIACYHSTQGWKCKLADKYNYEVEYSDSLRSALDAAMQEKQT